MSMFNDISWGSQDNEQECELSANLVSIFARRFSPGRWSVLGPGSEKKWYSTHHGKPRRDWDRVAELMMTKFAESKHPFFRSTSPLSRGVLKSRGGGKLSIHFCADGWTIETVFRTIISVNQLSIYGAVSDLYEEYKACHVRTVNLLWQDKLTCESGCAYNGITDFVTNMLMKVQHVAVSENSVHNSCVPFCGDLDLEFLALSRQTWRNLQHGLRLHVPGLYSKRIVNIFQSQITLLPRYGVIAWLSSCDGEMSCVGTK